MHNVTVRPHIIDRVLKRRGVHHLYETLDPARTALLVIDMMNMFMAPGAPAEVPQSRSIVGNINRLTKQVREIGSKVIWITRDDNVWHHFLKRFVGAEVRERTRRAMQFDSEGQQLWPELEVAAEDLRLYKTRYSAFSQGSRLEWLLRSGRIDTILIAGTKTNVCCESTAREGMMLDFDVVMVEDCCAALSDEEHLAALENVIQQFGDVMTGDEVVGRLKAGAAQPSPADAPARKKSAAGL